jgi:hypothetical protein
MTDHTHRIPLFDLFAVDVIVGGNFCLDLIGVAWVLETIKACFFAGESVEYTIELILSKQGL